MGTRMTSLRSRSRLGRFGVLLVGLSMLFCLSSVAQADPMLFEGVFNFSAAAGSTTLGAQIASTSLASQALVFSFLLPEFPTLTATGYFSFGGLIPSPMSGLVATLTGFGNVTTYIADILLYPPSAGGGMNVNFLFQDPSSPGGTGAVLFFTVGNNGSVLSQDPPGSAIVAGLYPAAAGSAWYDETGTGHTDWVTLTGSQVNISAVPEPSTILLLASGLLGIGLYSRKRAQQ